MRGVCAHSASVTFMRMEAFDRLAKHEVLNAVMVAFRFGTPARLKQADNHRGSSNKEYEQHRHPH